MHERECAPDETAAIPLCVLSFPALCFKVKKKEAQIDIGCDSAGRNECCIINVEEENSEFNFTQWIVNVKAALGPQPVFVEILFSRTAEDSGICIEVCVPSDERDGAEKFEWEL